MTVLTTNRLTGPESKDAIKLRASWIFGSLLFLFLIYVILYVPSSLPIFKQRILAVLSALLSGLFVFFLTGDIVMVSHEGISGFGKSTVKTSGGVAVFALVLWWWFSPLAPVGVAEGVYRVRVTVLDSQNHLVNEAKVWSSVGNEPLRMGDGWQISIPAESIPLDGRVVIFAAWKEAFFHGEYELILGDDPNPAITVRMEKDKSALIRGIVVDEKGRAIPGAKVTVAGYEQETVATSNEGNFMLKAHAAEGEKILLHIEAENFMPINQWHPAGDKPVTIVLEKR